jgi:ABC-type sugar transport system ATPase subunit
MASLELRNVVKRFGALEIIHGVDLTIEDGEFVVFVGPSGCGKSTLLRMIAGLEGISAGEVYIDGELVNDIAAAKRGLAMVFQSYALYPHMTVRKNLSFGLETTGAAKAEIRSRVAEAGESCRSTNCSNDAPGSFPAASASASQSAALSFASRVYSCSTSRCQISTQNSGCRCGWRSTSCTADWGRR